MDIELYIERLVIYSAGEIDPESIDNTCVES